MKREEKAKIIAQLEKDGVEVIKTRGNKALIRVPSIYGQPGNKLMRVSSIYGQPGTKWIDLTAVNENSFFTV